MKHRKSLTSIGGRRFSAVFVVILLFTASWAGCHDTPSSNSPEPQDLGTTSPRAPSGNRTGARSPAESEWNAYFVEWLKAHHETQVRGGDPEHPLDLNTMGPQIREATSHLSLSGQPHWIKIVFGQNKGRPLTVSTSLDNTEDGLLTSAIRGLRWPKSDKAYIVKQFIVIN
jgi:hypothetical protein